MNGHQVMVLVAFVVGMFVGAIVLFAGFRLGVKYREDK